MSKATKTGIVLALLVVVGVVVVLKTDEPCPVPDQPAQTPETGPAGSALEVKLPRLLDLGAAKCIPCKMMAPILEELKAAQAGKVRVDFADVWKDPDAGRQYGIRMIPTQIFYDADGNELFRHEGFMSKEDILAKWKELGIDVADEVEQAPE